MSKLAKEAKLNVVALQWFDHLTLQRAEPLDRSDPIRSNKDLNEATRLNGLNHLNEFIYVER
jgi:hypothetical protein